MIFEHSYFLKIKLLVMVAVIGLGASDVDAAQQNSKPLTWPLLTSNSNNSNLVRTTASNGDEDDTWDDIEGSDPKQDTFLVPSAPEDSGAGTRDSSSSPSSTSPSSPPPGGPPPKSFPGIYREPSLPSSNGQGGGASESAAGGQKRNSSASGGKSSSKSSSTDKSDKKNQSNNKSSVSGANNARRIENLDFQDAPIEDVMRSISVLTDKNFILDPTVKGRITILAPSEITPDEAYKAFQSALALNNLTIVPPEAGQAFYKIIPSQSAVRENIATYTKSEAPATDQMVTRIVKLKYLNPAEVSRLMRGMVNRNGDISPLEQTGSLIISDTGSNIKRLLKMIAELDQPGYEERMAVIPIHYAKAKEFASLIEQIISKSKIGIGGGGSGGFGSSSSSPFGGGFAPYTGGGRGLTTGGGGGGGVKLPELSVVIPDERTNSLIVVGNQDGIEKIRSLVSELDFSMDPAASGGVFVYRLRHATAEAMANTLSGVITKGGGAAGAQAPPFGQPSSPFAASGGLGSPSGGLFGSRAGAGGASGGSGATGGLFGGEVKILPEKNTNSLILVGSKQDFDVLRSLMARIDIPRDQVYVEAIIMELKSDKAKDLKLSGYYFDPDGKGVARAGISAGAAALSNLINPAADVGAVLGFGRGRPVSVRFGDKDFEMPSLSAFINFLQINTEANILSTPQIIAMDNDEALIEVGDQIPIGMETQVVQGSGAISSPKFDKATIRLEITPHISPDNNMISLKVNQSVRQPSDVAVKAEKLRDIATVLSDRTIKTGVVLSNEDTVVLGGLMRDEDSRIESKVPILGDIPVLGWLFRSTHSEKKKINLLVFLTPRIIRTSDDRAHLLQSKLSDRDEWLQEFKGGQEILENDLLRKELKRLSRRKASLRPISPAPQQNQP